MAEYTSNLQQLIAAGLVQEKNKLSPEELETIEKLSQDEVRCLVKTAKTLGEEYLEKVMHPLLKIY
jgi:hypothetical protein